ncbi:MAG TPA: XdhC family protein [Bacteroidia bacterium]|nr:XdhC family protein [Bacteroidia bacterium]
MWKFIVDMFKEEIPVALLCVLESKGSSPGRQGFKMAATLHEMVGSIGGGIMEHKLVETAREILHKERNDSIIKEQFHNKSAGQGSQSGMICSGEQTVFIYPVKENDILQIQNLIDNLEENKNGTLKISPEGIIFSGLIPLENYFLRMNGELDFEFVEKTGYKNHLYIVGGGHCSLAFSKMMSGMDFHLHVYEDRNHLFTFLQNDFVQEKKIVDDYSLLKDVIPGGENHYVVIMTFGYRTDKVALKTLIDKNFKYLGVLGSKSKIEKMFDELRNEGISENHLKKINAPVGINIKSETPEEIAVSIAGEIIKVKNTSTNTN